MNKVFCINFFHIPAPWECLFSLLSNGFSVSVGTVECRLVGSLSIPFKCLATGRSEFNGKSRGGLDLSGFFGNKGGDFLTGGFGLSSLPLGLESGNGGGSDFLVISSAGLDTGFNLTGISV